VTAATLLMPFSLFIDCLTKRLRADNVPDPEPVPTDSLRTEAVDGLDRN
jgi:hypothetical protein